MLMVQQTQGCVICHLSPGNTDVRVDLVTLLLGYIQEWAAFWVKVGLAFQARGNLVRIPREVSEIYIYT